MDGPIQNVFPYVLRDWPHTECFSKHAKWMAPYRMIIHVLHGWPHTVCFSTHTKWMAPYRMFFHKYYMGGPYRMLIITC